MKRAAAIVACSLFLTACGESGGESRGASPPVTTSTPTSTAAPADNPFAGKTQTDLDSLLIDAAWDNDLPKARQLIAAGADVNAKDRTKQSAYLVSTSEGYLDLLNLTLEHGADVDSLDKWQGTGLIRAAERGHTNIVGRLLRAGVKKDHVNNLGWVALHEAIVLGDGSRKYVDTVRVLVAGKADLSVRARRDNTSPIAQARARGFDPIAVTLDKGMKGESMSASLANRELLRAAREGDADAAALALRAGADIEARDADKRTPLLLAAIGDHTAVARLLVAMSADPDALDYRHDSAWLVTGVTGSVEMARTITAAKPNVALLNRYGGTSLIPASERGHDDYVAWVVEHTDVKVNHVNELGWTALLEAVILGEGSQRWQNIVSTLLKAGADRDIADKDGVTPLEHARRRGHEAVARMLTEA